MTDPRLPQSNDGDSSNGSTPPMAKPEADRLPQPPQLPNTETLSPAMKRDIRRAFLILLGTGLVIGLLTATGVVLVMNHFDLIGVPEQTAP